MKRLSKTKLLNEVADESGAGTAFAMLFALICIGIGGLAIDSSNVWSVKQRLQSATDIAAHAAAVSVVWPGEGGLSGTTSEIAIAALLNNAPASKFGVALQASDVVEGWWDPAAQVVVASNVDGNDDLVLDDAGEELLQAVSVTARLDGNVGNVVPTYILKLIGFEYWRVATTSVFVRDISECFDGGLIAGGKVLTTSNNVYRSDFCLHGNLGVKVRNDSVFGTGVHVSMPDYAHIDDGGMFDLDGASQIWEDGITNQLGEGYMDTSLTSATSIGSMLDALRDPAHEEQPDYINSALGVNRVTVRANIPLVQGDLMANAVNIVRCSGNGLNFPDGVILENMVIVANCKINFGQGAIAQNAIIATSQVGNQSINAPASVQFGEHDDCDPGGGVTLITQGNAKFAGDSSWNGAEVIARGNIHVSANAQGTNGSSFLAGGDIETTANGEYGACAGGTDHFRDVFYIRMVY